jgi:hypothetical protein
MSNFGMTKNCHAILIEDMTQLHDNERDLARLQVTISDSMISKMLTPLELIKAHANKLL